MSSKSPGEIITFYSYKGGTGRSMALSNIACILADSQSKGEGVLMIDWDLEAPGLHRFFHDRFKERFADSNEFNQDFSKHLGLIDLFIELESRIPKIGFGNENAEERANDVIESIDLTKFVIRTDIPNLSLLKAGCFDENYSTKVNTFNWEDLYNRLPYLFISFAEKLVREYKYVLIDSRTGYTDISGICTSLMPQKLVVVFTPNRQNYEGVEEIVKRATGYRRISEDLRPLLVYPLPTRIESSRKDLREEWRFGNPIKFIKGYQKIFESLFSDVYDLSNCSLDEYFREIQIQHSPDYAYGEEISVIVEKKVVDRFSLSHSYRVFAKWLIESRAPWQKSNNINMPRSSVYHKLSSISCSWMVDATYIKDLNALNSDLLFITPQIKEFLDIESGSKNFIIGTKGIGKTLFLRYKRLLYQDFIEANKDLKIILMPKNDLVDRRPIIYEFTKDKIEYFSNENVWADIWLLSILLSSLKATRESNYHVEDENFKDLFAKLNSSNFNRFLNLLNSIHINPTDFLGEIVTYPIKDIDELRKEIDSLISLVRSIDLNVVFFIDNIDELFKVYNQQKLLIPAWYNPQIGLMNAVLILSRMCRGIEVNASIRKEAFLKIQQDDPNCFELKEHVLDLTYTKNELKVIFVKNIKSMDRKKLVYPEDLNYLPLNSFFGFNFIRNEDIKKEENIFDYIYRHTLQRPRDLMVIGAAIEDMSKFDKNTRSIKRCIDSLTREIGEQYISEVTPHIDICKEDLYELFKLMDTNIYTYDRLKTICCKFNSENSCEAKKCNECSKTHIFCNLYEIGLLGALIGHVYGTKKYQKFLPPGAMLFKCDSFLPESYLYLLHPVLYENISKTNIKFKVSPSITVGDGLLVTDSDLDNFTSSTVRDSHRKT